MAGQRSENTSGERGGYRLALTFIINGASFPLEVSPEERLHDAVARALGESGNTGRPASEWIARNAAGDELDQRKRIGELGLTTGSLVYLSLTAGVGG